MFRINFVSFLFFFLIAIFIWFNNSCTALTIINPNGPVSFRCMDCICDTVSECSEEAVCVDGDACGMYRITPLFWMDAGRPTIDGDDPNMDDEFANCAIDRKCATKTVQQYMERYKRDCNNDGSVDCKDYFALHILGSNCNKTLHENFLKRFDQCDQPLKKVPATQDNSNIFLPNYDDDCQKCLCEAATGCNETVGCSNGFCGMYKISRKYWEDAGRVTLIGDDPDRRNAYEDCALNKECAEKTMKFYFRKFGKDCNNDQVTSCTDYLMLNFNGGKYCGRTVTRNQNGFDVMTRFNACMNLNKIEEVTNLL